MKNVLEAINSAWAITPPMLEKIHEIYLAKIEGRETEWLAAQTEPPSFTRESYAVEDGVAVIPITGVIAQKMNLFSSISGGTSTQMLSADIAAAVDDPSVDAILLDVDSPGGTVMGMERLAEQIRAARKVKPVAAWTSGTMASAAYWIASAADKVYIDANDTSVGSIGIVTKHVDTSAAAAKQGVKVTEITAGKYKRVVSEHAPLSEDGKAEIQAVLDHHYTNFVGSVAANRGVSVEQVLADMADGRTFQGTQAIDAGLVDAVASRSEVISTLRSRVAQRQARARKEYFMALTAAQVKAEAPDVAKELIAEGVAAGRAEGMAAERDRIAAIQSLSMAGHEDLIASMIADGVSAEAAALKIVKAEQALKASAAKAYEDDAPPPMPTKGSIEDKQELTAEQKVQKAQAFATEKGISVHAALTTLFGNSIH